MNPPAFASSGLPLLVIVACPNLSPWPTDARAGKARLLIGDLSWKKLTFPKRIHQSRTVRERMALTMRKEPLVPVAA